VADSGEGGFHLHLADQINGTLHPWSRAASVALIIQLSTDLPSRAPSQHLKLKQATLWV